MRSFQFCGKTKQRSVKRKKLRGQYNPVKKTWQKPNLQWLNIDDKKILVCKNCRRLILKGKER
jgi:hypothetical protein